jgi:hypothetical protein
MFFSVKSLLNVESQLVTFLIPVNLEDIEGSSHQPGLFPLLKSEFRLAKVVAKFLQKIIDSCIAPLETVEVAAERLGEVFLAHKEHQLLKAGSSLGVCDPIEDRFSLGSVQNRGSY